MRAKTKYPTQKKVYESKNVKLFLSLFIPYSVTFNRAFVAVEIAA